jgi:DNA-binding transcriptional LysR family regulator
MEFDLRLLPAFVALADELHFGRAAARLNIGQPALSQQLARLERQLGVVLMQRDSRRVSLTPAGHAFLAGARSALVLARNAAVAARRAQPGRPAFRLGVDIDMPAGLVRRIRRFGSREAGVDLRVTIAQQDDLLGALETGELDAVVAWTAPPLGTALAGDVLAAVAIHGVVRDDDPLARGPALSPGDLTDHALAIYLPGEETRPFYDHLLDRLAVEDRVPRAAHVDVVDGAQDAMLDAVERSGGFTICVEGSLDASDRPALVELPFDPPLRTDVVCLWHGAQEPAVLGRLRSRLSSDPHAHRSTWSAA